MDRAWRICNSHELFHQEILRITEVLRKNEYPNSVIQRQIEKFLNKKLLKKPTITTTPNGSSPKQRVYLVFPIWFVRTTPMWISELCSHLQQRWPTCFPLRTRHPFYYVPWWFIRWPALTFTLGKQLGAWLDESKNTSMAQAKMSTYHLFTSIQPQLVIKSIMRMLKSLTKPAHWQQIAFKGNAAHKQAQANIEQAEKVCFIYIDHWQQQDLISIIVLLAIMWMLVINLILHIHES